LLYDFSEIHFVLTTSTQHAYSSTRSVSSTTSPSFTSRASTSHEIDFRRHYSVSSPTISTSHVKGWSRLRDSLRAQGHRLHTRSTSAAATQSFHQQLRLHTSRGGADFEIHFVLKTSTSHDKGWSSLRSPTSCSRQRLDMLRPRLNSLRDQTTPPSFSPMTST